MNSMVMQKDIISNWEPRHASLLGVELVKLNHRLIETGLFTREALGRVIERLLQRGDRDLRLLEVEADLPETQRPIGAGGGQVQRALVAVEHHGAQRGLPERITHRPRTDRSVIA